MGLPPWHRPEAEERLFLVANFQTGMNAKLLRWLRPLLFVGLFAALGVRAESTDNPCGPLYTQHYGPFDYRTQKPRLEIVERAHFTPMVESLIRGQSGDLGKDLNYTLRAAPNHHRALVAIVRWGERLKSRSLPGMEHPIDCWFERALRFAPDDHVARSLFARYVGKQGQLDLATRQLDIVLNQSNENPMSIYNVGLIFFELGLSERALEQAHKAKAAGYTRPELEEMLRKAGQWRDLPP